MGEWTGNVIVRNRIFENAGRVYGILPFLHGKKKQSQGHFQKIKYIIFLKVISCIYSMQTI